MRNATIFTWESTAHRVVHRLAVFIVLLHTTVGCCWQHSPVKCASCDGNTTRPNNGLNISHRCNTQCSDVACDFATPTRRTATKVSPNLIALAGVKTCASAVSMADPPRHLLNLPRLHSRPSLRLHLLNQMLLI